ncbi:MAG: GTPase [Planctomycetia bacterium]
MASSLPHPADLIIAPATVPGAGARAIVRLSGEGLARLLGEMLVPASPGAFAAAGPARCVAARLGGGLAAEWGPLAVDVLWWPGPGGPTGGPLAEIQVPASAPLVDALVAEACARGARLARRGEFSLRSFLAGRLDLVQAEAVLAVVEAHTPAELSAALDRMAGGAGRRLDAVREQLLDILADIEAVIDFSDEQSPDHVAPGDAMFWKTIDARLDAAAHALAEVRGHLAGRDAAAADVPRAVLVGRPNIGKSSLFNALAEGAAALVADEAGTTRDWIGARLEGAGTACLLVDLAGIDQSASAGTVAAAAEAVARAEIARADVLVVCRDATDAGPLPALPADIPTISVLTRADRAAGMQAAGGTVTDATAPIATSVRDRRGIDELRGAILAAVAGLEPRGPTATVRMRVGVEAAHGEIAAARTAAGGALRDEAVVAGHLGRAVEAIDAATGRHLATDLLDRIFERHCIGK